MQGFKNISENDGLLKSLSMIMDNDKTALSCSSGNSFPTADVHVGQLCFRSDQNRLFQADKDRKWIEIADLNDSSAQQKLDEILKQAVRSVDSWGSTTIMRDGFGRFSLGYTHTGPIVIKLPINTANAMVTIRVRGYAYGWGFSSWDLDLGGSIGRDGYWTRTSASSKSVTPWGNEVRFGEDGKNAYVVIGGETTNWSYPVVWIEEVMTHYKPAAEMLIPSRYEILALKSYSDIKISQLTKVTGPQSVSVADDMSSSRHVKGSVSTIDNALAKVEKLNGVTFECEGAQGRHAGLLVQDVEATLPEAVIRTVLNEPTAKAARITLDGEPSPELEEVESEDSEVLSINYGSMAGLLVEALKEVSAKLKDQQKLIDKQAKLIKDLTNKVSH